MNDHHDGHEWLGGPENRVILAKNNWRAVWTHLVLLVLGEIALYAFLTFGSGSWGDLLVAVFIIILFALAYFLIGLRLLDANCRPFQASVSLLSVLLLVGVLSIYLSEPIACFGFYTFFPSPIFGQLLCESLFNWVPYLERWCDLIFVLAGMLPAILILFGMRLQKTRLSKLNISSKKDWLTEAVKKAQDNGQTPPHKSTDIESRFQDEK